jgi:cytochrome c-type biogenesis protein CcmE
VRRGIRLLVGGTIAVSAMGMALVGTLQSTVPFLTPSEVGSSLEGRRIQVEGIVVGLEATTGGLTFHVSDGRSVVPVDYRYGAGRPLALENGRLAVVKGVFRDGIIVAQHVSIRAHEGVEPAMTAIGAP